MSRGKRPSLASVGDTSRIASAKPDLTEFRKHLQACEAKGWEHLDDVVFKIAAGGLALSLTLLGLTKNVTPFSMKVMFGVWACLALALLALMFSVLTGQEGLRSQITRVDEGDYYHVAHPEGKLGQMTPWLNRLAIASCAFGLLLLMVFAISNLSR
jgi:hypothetical protein